MRLIDADTFSDEMRNRQNAAYELMQHSEKGSETNIRMDSAYAAFIECALTLDKMQTIDAVPVVRCKDCKNRWPDLDEGKMICLLDRSRRADDEEWFCADGKRKVAESE